MNYDATLIELLDAIRGGFNKFNETLTDYESFYSAMDKAYAYAYGDLMEEE